MINVVVVQKTKDVVLMLGGQTIPLQKGADGKINFPAFLTNELVKKKVEDAFLALETGNPHVYEE